MATKKRVKKASGETPAKRVNGKKKGSRFERVICKWFTDWTGYEFNRVPASGGLRWKNAENITSDVACTDSKHSRRFNFSVECKNYQDLNFEHILLEKKTCKILKFWEQARDDAARAKKLPLLIMHYNGMPKGEAFVVFSNAVYNGCIKDHRSELKKSIMGIHINLGEPVSEASSLYVILLSDLKNLNYKTFHKEATAVRKKLNLL